ncbi:hypothetical protein CF15_01745 [Pyrodictium occultum]|uniref:HD domain-containing protein n=1 Tax=Pyrodictium occultum TaxID=2309 RepID=A0A0V8RU32_PYROC|nr:HD domain-containing protein [Pyrodictium occultum]KSW11582.1 hypothetical protein CF15_01745 [Pyrodictium occultum]
MPAPAGALGLASRILEELDRGEELASGTRTLRLHSLLVAHYASLIASRLGLDPVAYYLAGLLHDYGKLEARERGLDEDEYTAEKAAGLLEVLGAPEELARRVAGILRRGARRDPVLGDADVLAKLGLQGVAQFIAKWTARGSSLAEMLVEGLPRELTVALNPRLYLCTGPAREAGERLAGEAVEAYTRLLEEAEEALGLGLRLVEERVEGVRAVFVAVERCPRCLSPGLERRLEPHRGRLCRGLRMVHRCPRCGWAGRGGVCLPWRRCGPGEPTTTPGPA